MDPSTPREQQEILRNIKHRTLSIPEIKSLRQVASEYNPKTLSNGMLINRNGDVIPVKLNGKPLEPHPEYQVSSELLQLIRDKITPQVTFWIENYPAALLEQKKNLGVKNITLDDIEPHEIDLINQEGLFAKKDINAWTVIGLGDGMLIPNTAENEGSLRLLGGKHCFGVLLGEQSVAPVLGFGAMKKANARFSEDGFFEESKNNIIPFLVPVELQQKKIDSQLRTPGNSPRESDEVAEDYFSHGVVGAKLMVFFTTRDIAQGEQIAYSYGNPIIFAQKDALFASSEDQDTRVPGGERIVSQSATSAAWQALSPGFTLKRALSAGLFMAPGAGPPTFTDTDTETRTTQLSPIHTLLPQPMPGPLPQFFTHILPEPVTVQPTSTTASVQRVLAQEPARLTAGKRSDNARRGEDSSFTRDPMSAARGGQAGRPPGVESPPGDASRRSESPGTGR